MKNTTPKIKPMQAPKPRPMQAPRPRKEPVNLEGNTNITIRLTKLERAEFKDAAAHAGITMSQFLRLGARQAMQQGLHLQAGE